MHKLKFLTISVILVLLLSVASPSMSVFARPLGAATDPGLGAASSYSIIAQTAITNVPTSTISGNVGLNNAGTFYAGLTSLEVGGTIYDTNGTGPSEGLLPPAVQADLLAAFTTNIPGQPLTANIGPVLDGLTLVSGVYDIGAGELNGGVLTLNGPGVYIFRSTSTTVSTGSINLINGARACDVFWRVETAATINGSSFIGTILAGAGIHFGANVTLDGRALAVGGDVTMISDVITGPSCAVAPAVPTEVPVEDNTTTKVSALPNTGGAPIRDDSFPWTLMIFGGFGATALVLGVLSYRRTYKNKQ